MKIWITRHGQTRLNAEHRMQGLTDEPLNETGIRQAKEARARIGDMKFDAVYASPLDRAIVTASIIGNVSREEVRIDPRITETNFGKYELRKYYCMGPRMNLYWTLPEIFPAPKSVETIRSMTERAGSFLRDIEKEPFENVLVVCHGGSIRALCGCLEKAPRGIRWRPKPRNCEIRVYEPAGEKYCLSQTYRPD